MEKFKPTDFTQINTKYENALRAWSHLIPPSTPCVLAEYSQGHEVGSSEKGFFIANQCQLSFPLGIVLEGRVELYQIFTAGGFATYRPVRIMQEGELFGDFAVIDNCLGLDNNTPHQEMWEICAGFKSFLLTQSIPKIDRHIFQKFDDQGNPINEDIYTHLFFDEIINTKTIIVFFGSSFIKRGCDFYNKLIDYSWPKTKIYRDSLNSFNYTHQLQFKKNALEIAANLLLRRNMNNKCNTYTNRINKKGLLPLFLDVIWDTCNRPLRSEPMFAQNPSLPIKDKTKLKYYNIKPKNIHCATDYYDDQECIFPIDGANYLLASYTANNNNLMSDFNTIFGGNRDVKSSATRNARKFYIALANELLKKLITNTDQYPYDVECIETSGICPRHIILSFKKK